MASFAEDPLQHMLACNAKWAQGADEALLAKNAKGQQPKVLWFGCSDSRVPESVVCQRDPGDVFVHRNIANTYHTSDASANAVLAYAINHLGVRIVVVAGHYSCGGVAAALSMAKSSAAPPTTSNGVDDTGEATIAHWLEPAAALGKQQLAKASGVDDVEAQRELVRSHALNQAANIRDSPIVRRAIREGKEVTVHAWVYDVGTGRLTDLAQKA